MSYILENKEDYSIFKLSRSKNGASLLYKNIYKYESAEEILKHINKISNKIILADDDSLKKELEEIDKIGAIVITYQNKIYPSLLKSISDFPIVLTCKGNVELLKNERKVSIIGSRNTSINSFNFSKTIAKEVSSYGYIVVSGMAKGIDKSAHIGSLENGTIAVLGSGIDIIYPKENEYLYYNIIKNNGLIITEFPLHTSPKPENFPIRNRIIAGLSRGVIVMEAGRISGTMHTINQANNYGREVMIFPGNPYDDRFAGSNRLLQDGATMVVDSRDIIENLESFSYNNNTLSDSVKFIYDYYDYKSEKDPETIEDIILSKLDYSEISINELIDNMQEYDLNSINSTLVKLQLDNKILMDFGKISLKLN